MSEVCGSSADIRLAMTEFRDCILDTGLIHLPVQGERFSWHNCSEGDRSLWKRLDRIIVNDAWLGHWPCSHYHCLNARTSDHSPLVIRGDTVSHTVSMFRFDNYLTMSSEFITSVQNIWRHQIAGTNMYAVTRKLRALKQVFRTLRKKKGDLSLNVKLAAEFLGHASTKGKIQWLKGGDQCSRIFFRKVAMRRASKKVFQIANEAGRTLTEQDEVVDEFVSFYQRLLGEDKAPGPDGYSSGFYKAAWPVIGDEVVKAILEFFTTGRLLKQVNTTLLALIPKIRVPNMVSDFRPISCCNVLYKVITKIIVQRLRLVLDAMISPSQNAFVPGRSIGDNILLAQEMFTGYNRQGLPKRCALKIDLRKAYDTVEWDFLIAALQMFGFPDIFIGWIEECVTTPMFSCALMGTLMVFSRVLGVATGGSDAPFLFVLVMEVLQLMMQQLIDQNGGFSFHWRCKELGYFSYVLPMILLLQGRCGLDPAQEEREHLIAALQFQEGHLPLRYLGLPLLASRLSISDCHPLLLKVDSRIKGWDSIQLSFAGRLQLIKSVLMSLNVYWAMPSYYRKGSSGK
ncbi:UNVERIFIED_CONTAM: hypothetical protein Sangu_3186100 [Sesamum angustifolium]|uniref:Reverse transcriptase domain-containing protein n=1 Tax=Sesamum angustifolium TaxID=2727405 RepID=A0AAW2JQB3_9LAMI